MTDVEGEYLTIEKTVAGLYKTIEYKNRARPQCAWKINPEFKSTSGASAEMQPGLSIILGALAVGVAWV
jgi:hypothetical protein